MRRGGIAYGKDEAATVAAHAASNVRAADPAVRGFSSGSSTIRNLAQSPLSRFRSLAAVAGLVLVLPVAAAAQSATPASSKADPAPASAATAYPKVGEILDRYEKAIGGRAAWEKFSSQVMMGTIEVPSMELSGTVMIHEKAPNKVLVAVIINGAAFQQGFDGTIGWTDDPKNGLRDQAGAELAEAKRASDFLHSFKMRRAYASMAVAGSEKIGERDTWVIEAGVPEGGDPTKMYFDKQSGLLLRAISQNHDADGVSQLKEDFDDYREVDGVKMPFVSRQTNGDTTYTMRISEVHHNVDLSDSEFAKPAAQAAQ